MARAVNAETKKKDRGEQEGRGGKRGPAPESRSARRGRAGLRWCVAHVEGGSPASQSGRRVIKRIGITRSTLSLDPHR